MRKSLLKTFDKIYTIDLHGNSKKKKLHLMVQRMKMFLTLCKEYQ